MAVSSAVEAQVRPVTEEEVEFFIENGWAKLPSLISRETAGLMLKRAKEWMSEGGSASDFAGSFAGAPDHDGQTITPRTQDETFKGVATSQELGRNAARLLGRDCAMRIYSDFLAVKAPASAGVVGSTPTRFHQDVDNPFDRPTLAFWIALDEVTPAQGTMRFFTKSHHLGPLGSDRIAERIHDTGPAPELSVETWPRLARCPLSEPFHLQPGDATVHHRFLVHGAPANTTARPRWGYVELFFPADALYTGLPSALDGLGLEPLKPFDHPNFPITYSPQ